MHPKSMFHKLALGVATGALATLTMAGPAIAAPAGGETGSVTTQADSVRADGAQAQQLFRGRVIARTGLNVRANPNTSSRILRTLPFGRVINDIVCKVNSQVIDGNPRWYKLKSGGWVAARYVQNIGPAPRFC